MTDAKSKRLIKEIESLQASATNTDPSSTKFLLDKSSFDDQPSGSQAATARASPTIILGRILPNSDIYKQAAFRIEMTLLPEYPFKAPEIKFIPPIYHPNVDNDGKVSIDKLNGSEEYKARTPLIDIVKAVTNLIDNPQIEHPLNAEIAAEYVTNRDEFNRKALESVKEHGVPRQ